MSIIQLDNTNFKDTIEGQEKPVIVDFYADWCVPCKMISPILEEIEKEGEIVVYKVNIDENPELAVEFEVRSIPNLISFKGGKMYKQTLGVQPKQSILEIVR